MEKSASANQVLTLKHQPPAVRSVAAACSNLTLRCLKAIARGYAQSAVYYPYYVFTGPIPNSRIERESAR